MKKFNHFITEQELMQNTAEDLMEKLITFGGKAYPKFGNIVIMAGGAGSGKGFVLNKLVGVEGKVFDVDELKRLASKTPAIKKRVKKELGVDIEVAQAQNAKRARRVPSEILINTHRGAANTMGDIINMGNKLKKYMDGDIVFAFNKVGVDANLATSGKGGSYVKDANYFYVKKQGKAPTSIDKLDKDIRRKIKGYVPKNVEWD